MVDFRSSLLREKFLIHDTPTSPAGAEKDTAKPVIALSNRLVVPLEGRGGMDLETYVIRSQNMHSCARLAAIISREYQEGGPLMSRTRKYRWQDGWHNVVKGYERKWNPDIWACVYHKGRPVFEAGERHPFLDIIEQCDIKNAGGYEDSLSFAEEAFKKAGKKVTIEHDSNVALVVNITSEQVKCGVIVRAPHKTTTFNFTAKPKEQKDQTIQPVRISTALTVSAAFLEGIQLAFLVGMTNKKRSYDLIEPRSDDDKRGKDGSARIGDLTRAITHFEDLYDVAYRPERPSFQDLVKEAETLATTLLRPQIEAKIATGQLDDGDWVL